MKYRIVFLAFAVALNLTGCSLRKDSVLQAADPAAERKQAEQTVPSEQTVQPENIFVQEEQREWEELQMQLLIDGTAVSVAWENNASVDALKSLLENGSVTVTMSGYGGFELVGSLPKRLTSNDCQMKTDPGDIVLYNSSSLVLFYGSNFWAYTRLGKIIGLDSDQLRDLLSSATEVEVSLR